MADEKASADDETQGRKPPRGHVDAERTRVMKAPSASPGGSASPRPRRGGLQALAIVLVVAGFVLAFWWWPDEEAQPPAETAPASVPPPPPIEQPDRRVPATATDTELQKRLRYLQDQAQSSLTAAERDQRLAGLFEAFRSALADGDLELPAADSASEYLLRMMALGPEHPTVVEARSMLARAFLERAREARLAERWDEADRYLQSAVDIRAGPAAGESDAARQ